MKLPAVPRAAAEKQPASATASLSSLCAGAHRALPPWAWPTLSVPTAGAWPAIGRAGSSTPPARVRMALGLQGGHGASGQGLALETSATATAASGAVGSRRFLLFLYLVGFLVSARMLWGCGKALSLCQTRDTGRAALTWSSWGFIHPGPGT